MNDRKKILLKIRPEIKKNKPSIHISEEEIFQNNTLRPILKFQNTILIELFIDYVKKHKKLFFELNNKLKFEFIENIINKDQKFKAFIKGLVIGYFTMDEFKFYLLRTNNINKRLYSLLSSRLKDQIKQLDF
tara:strand:- start:195 stop:590 length:396 start_codon:yes stop_codon:yes gene_type:complete